MARTPVDNWFDPALGFLPLLPLQRIYDYLRFASGTWEYQRTRKRGLTRAAVYRSERVEAQEDYYASLAASGVPTDAYYYLTPQAFNAVWNQANLLWQQTTPEIRRHVFDQKARTAWTEPSTRNLFRSRYAFHVGLVVQGSYDRQFDTAHNIGGNSFARLIVEYETISHSVDQTVTKAAQQADEWRTNGSELYLLCGNVLNILRHT